MNKLENKKVLLVTEDDISLRNVLRDQFLSTGFSVLEAENGEQGFAKAIDAHPDLILLDILMPHINGIDMMKRIRNEDEWGKKVPIILLSNLSPDTEAITKAVTEYQPAYYIVKSNATLDEIVDKVKERLANESESPTSA